jgi:TolB-like protein
MKAQLLKFTGLCVLTTLTACSSMSDMLPSFSDVYEDPQANNLPAQAEPIPVNGESSFQQKFMNAQILIQQREQFIRQNADKNEEDKVKSQQQILTKNINHYVRGLMQDMAGNLQYVSASTPVAVASFVFLDGPYDSTNLLGNQIAESFIHEIRKFDIPVLDFKTTGYIRITPDGDFAQSRDYLELSENTQITYILTGTLVKHQGGYLVNARMVGMKSRIVVASAQSLIPYKVADALLSSQNDDLVPIKTEQAPNISLVQG